MSIISDLFPKHFIYVCNSICCLYSPHRGCSLQAVMHKSWHLYVTICLKLKCLTALLFYCLSCCSLCCSLFDHQILPEANQTKFHSLLQGYFQSVKKCLVGEHKELHKRQRKNQQILQVNYQPVNTLPFLSLFRTKENCLMNGKKKMKSSRKVMRNCQPMFQPQL